MVPQNPRTIHSKQARSRETTGRILEATASLLAEKTLPEITVGEICERAGISVGGFYRRFTTKEAALYELNQHVMDQLAAHFEREFRPDELRAQPLSAVIHAYVSMGVRAFVEHRTVLRQLMVLIRMLPDPELRQRLVKFNRHAHDRFRDVLWARIDEIPHPDARAAIDLGLVVVSAGMRELTIYSDTRTGVAHFEEPALIAELTRVYCAYLGIPFEKDDA